MTRDEVRAAGRRIARWHKRFVGLFGHRETREHSEVYLRGPLSNLRRKNVEAIALAAGRCCCVEEFFHDAKRYLGMADYETRAWASWHHHMSLVALAHLYVTLTKGELNKGTPELTLDMAVRVLQTAFAHATFTEDDAIALLDYHLRRNRQAQQSHRKSRLRKHKKRKLEPSLQNYSRSDPINLPRNLPTLSPGERITRKR